MHYIAYHILNIDVELEVDVNALREMLTINLTTTFALNLVLLQSFTTTVYLKRKCANMINETVWSNRSHRKRCKITYLQSLFCSLKAVELWVIRKSCQMGCKITVQMRQKRKTIANIFIKTSPIFTIDSMKSTVDHVGYQLPMQLPQIKINPVTSTVRRKYGDSQATKLTAKR